LPQAQLLRGDRGANVVTTIALAIR